MNGIRLRNRMRVYDLFSRIGATATKKRGVLSLVPYTGCVAKRRVAVDDVEYPGFGQRLPAGVEHARNGSLVTLWYKAMHAPTKRQLAEANLAVKVMGIPRRRYTGRLVDVFRHSNGSLYCLLMDVLERHTQKGAHPFRMMNLDDGDLYAAFVEEPAARKVVKVVAKNPLGTGKTKSRRKVK